MKKVFLASDHAGFDLKEALSFFLTERGYIVEDMAPHTFNPDDDYPDFIIPLARKIVEDKGSFGIVLGMSGEGEAIAANRVKGARAAVYYGGSSDIITLSRQHNDSNILSLSAKFLSQEEAKDAALLWLTTDFIGEERHRRRIAKLDTNV